MRLRWLLRLRSGLLRGDSRQIGLSGSGLLGLLLRKLLSFRSLSSILSFELDALIVKDRSNVSGIEIKQLLLKACTPLKAFMESEKTVALFVPKKARKQ